MPAVNPGAGGANGPQQQRTTFRPPWVKDSPEPIPMPTAPWTLARTRQRGQEQQEQGLVMPTLKPIPRKNSTTTSNNVTQNSSGPSGAAKTEPTPARKTSKITIIPSRPSVDAELPKENGHDAGVNSKANSRTQPVANEAKKQAATPARKQSEAREAPKQEVKQIPIEIKSTTKPKQEEAKQVSKKQEEPPRKASIKAEEPKQTKAPQPPAPPMPPMPPPPPLQGNKKPITAVMAEKLENLRCRPRKRPDWGKLMKDVETGHQRLKHVQCNDRSSPLIPQTKVKGRFMYESEKPNVHNLLLKEIQSGINLKKVKTNDRSKPQLDGLRKFRRQLTIEEQIQKAETEETETEPDELDDIDKVRDDLQSTKQMLALELRNREAVERENKKLLTRILNMEVELEKERAKMKVAEHISPQAKREEDEQEQRKLRKDLNEAQKNAEEMESKYHDTAGQLDMARSDIEELQRKNQILERKLQQSILNQENGGEQPLRKQPSAKKLASAKASAVDVQQAMGQDKKPEEDEESEYEEVTETETESSEDEEEDAAVLQERRTARELKLLATKLKSFKEKEETAKKERKALRDQLKKQQKILKEEKKKYKQLQKEVDNVANMMKDEVEDEDEDEEEEESEESESESESEESEDDESDGDLPPEAPAERRKVNLTERAKRHENCLAALRKGNYLLKANIDRLKDDLFKQKEMSVALQEDLNSVLAELG